jgi:diguanylate cyclase (GGDEF)-like protein/PAS domain S-box-containing protein
MAGVLVALMLCALLACASWVLAAASRMLVARPHAEAIAGWAGLSALAALIDLIAPGSGHPYALAALTIAAVCVAIGIIGSAGLASSSAGLASAAAEALLVGSSLVSILWVVAGAPAAPSASALAALTLTTIDATAAALIVRVPVGDVGDGPDGRLRRAFTVGLSGICLLGVADGLMTLRQLGAGLPAALDLSVRAGAYLTAACVPWIGTRRPAPVRLPRDWAARLPYVLVASAVGAHLFAAFQGRVGPVSVVLVALVAAGLAVVQGLALRENARLLRDLNASRTQLMALVENAGDVILGIDVTGRVASANQAAARLLHRTPAAMLGMYVAELAVAQDRQRLRDAVSEVVGGRRGSERVEMRLAAPATGTAELRLRGLPGGAVANLSDVTDSVQLRERLERLARFDEMTGLANRSHLLDEVGGWLRAGERVSVLYADLDGFKAVNDRFGHLCGDGVLIEAAHRLANAATGLPVEQTLVARMGGDEFVVAVCGARPGALAVVTDRVMASMRPTFAVADRAVRVGLSIGVAGTDDAVPEGLDPGDADHLLHRADLAMFAAKQAGRFRVMPWDPAMEARAMRRVDIAIGLRRALDSGRLALAYQPLVRLTDGVVIGVEALIRVAGGDNAPGSLAGLTGLVTPAELVAVAEDTGEISEMGQWVLTEATHQAAGWRALGHDIAITVNVSVRQLAADGFAESVHRALHAAQLPAGSLVVEITEGQLLSEQDPGWRAVEQLREMGVVLVIDDFGSGYSSLAYLRRMPVRGVKLDRALLEDLTVDPRARTLARAVIAAARALGLLVVAEGLESLEAARIVRDLGAFAGQGFALFEAMPGPAVAGVLAGPPVSLGADLPEPEPQPRRPEGLSGPAGPVGPVAPEAPEAAANGPALLNVVDLSDLSDLTGPDPGGPVSCAVTAPADLT